MTTTTKKPKQKKLVWNTQGVIAFCALVIAAVVCFALHKDDAGWAFIMLAGGSAVFPQIATRRHIGGGDDATE